MFYILIKICQHIPNLGYSTTQLTLKSNQNKGHCIWVEGQCAFLHLLMAWPVIHLLEWKMFWKENCTGNWNIRYVLFNFYLKSSNFWDN